MSAQSAVPSVEKEINRKSIETLQDLMVQAEQGLISPVAFHLAVHTLWKAVSGLIPEDLSKLIEEVDGLNPPAYVERRVFEKYVGNGMDVAIVENHPSSAEILIRVYKPGQGVPILTTFKRPMAEERAKNMNEIASRLIKKGFQEV